MTSCHSKKTGNIIDVKEQSTKPNGNKTVSNVLIKVFFFYFVGRNDPEKNLLSLPLLEDRNKLSLPNQQ
jgi:hypothetical protein